MAIDHNNLRNYVEKKEYDPEILNSTIKDVVFVVLKRHYSSHLHDEELLSLGTFKAFSLLTESHIDPKKSLVNCIYTGVRNEIGNFLKRYSKEVPLAEESENFISGDSNEDLELLEKVKKKFNGHVQQIVGNLDIFGIKVSGNISTYMETFNDKGLCEYGRIAVRAAMFRCSKELRGARI